MGTILFARWWLEHLKSSGYFELVCSKSTLAHFTWEKFQETPFPMVPLHDQQIIAAYLDQETGRIDALVERLVRLIALLTEKRQAVISHAVTKGLNPDAPMKDSGIDWLGEVPADWQVVPFTWMFTESKQRALPGDVMLSATQKYGVIPLDQFEELEGRSVTKAFSHLEKRKHVEIDDFVISMRSADGGLERARSNGSVRSSYTVLKRASDADVEYFGYLLKSDQFIQALRSSVNFLRDGQDFNFGHVRTIRLPKPTPSHQAKIARYLDKELGKIDGLVQNSRALVAQLKERRSALISAAVTGQISIAEMTPDTQPEDAA
ncbi:restriction endonuclease subunit S [Jannaschia marina]|uniref:restriction endonuclease subunit S n=1 Tax=Jannaschia marina TaxID=2741674 RepID=UPI0015CD70A7|nr:restriction endonuclease subunit S [Jannaschia marina]